MAFKGQDIGSFVDSEVNSMSKVVQTALSQGTKRVAVKVEVTDTQATMEQARRAVETDGDDEVFTMPHVMRREERVTKGRRRINGRRFETF